MDRSLRQTSAGSRFKNVEETLLNNRHTFFSFLVLTSTSCCKELQCSLISTAFSSSCSNRCAISRSRFYQVDKKYKQKLGEKNGNLLGVYCKQQNGMWLNLINFRGSSFNFRAFGLAKIIGLDKISEKYISPISNPRNSFITSKYTVVS